MLKALELAGFKSFADRTKFEFPSGVSVVVGPNGSGKSNVVDAVKWVLGSQSAKSLRGKEMTDVIFNGAATRGPLGTAEATLTFDNSKRLLPIDASEVHVTRRVFRSGEAEYLINRQACRLRDIKELLAGTGITTEAYCIIEQGRVDALLQSSPRERRVIFEEAAGISQFKLKKASATRRLERVDQNLLRLSDIVDEVESRLRSVRSQAGKARRYRELADRLRSLRTQVGLADWRASSKQIASHDDQLQELRGQSSQRESNVDRCEQSLAEIERRLAKADQRIRDIESAAAATRERISAREAIVENLASRRDEIDEEVDRARRQLIAMTLRTGANQGELRDTSSQLARVEAECKAASHELREHQAQVEALQQQVAAAHQRFEELESHHASALSALTALGLQTTQLETRLAAVQAEQEFSSAHGQRLQSDIQEHNAEVAAIRAAETEIASQIETSERAKRDVDRRLSQLLQELARADRNQRELDGRIGRTRERIAVLTELEQRHDGLDASIQDLLQSSRDTPDGPFGDVCGIVADLLHVDVDSAPLVELALGPRAQFLVLASPDRLFDWLKSQPLTVAERIGFLRLDLRPALTALDHVDLSTEPGVMGRADQFVEAAPEFLPLVARLLGRTWFVDHWATALRLALGPGRGLDFVTSDGEYLGADGTLIVGPRQGAVGLLSRRSELRSCNEQLQNLERQQAIQQQIHAQLDTQRAALDELATTSNAVHTKLTTALALRREQSLAAESRLENLQTQWADHSEKQHSLDATAAALSAELRTVESDRVAAESTAERCRSELQACRHQMAVDNQRAEELQSLTSEKQVVAAKCEQRAEMLRDQMQQALHNQQERDNTLAETRRQIALRQSQVDDIVAAMLAERQLLAELFLQKESLIAERDHTLGSDATLRHDRAELTAQARTERKQLHTVQQQLHQSEVARSRLQHELETLCARMQDDYGIDLAQEALREASVEEAVALGQESGAAAISRDSRAAIEREIGELRTQLSTIGAVNLDALDELDDLESRFGNLSQQYRDLVDAKATLERIVQRINSDSRQIFVATLEIVRGHFQELFRRLFGGGEADIVIDDAEDVLECGIEIIARPPGKEKCSISLLSGGEKTLTCVALLLAVFRSKPSPFCVLDEVDAALDEANIGRFIQVLREFLSFTQFVVVSHSKRTMSGADTLYGVTMEESGVSKRVSVRFDDVGEDGQILSTSQKSGSPSTAAGAATPARKAA